MSPEAAAPTTIKVGVSQCLLGAKVRFDGGHKRDLYLVDTLGRFFEFVPICPEVEIGMGIPREPVNLRRSDAGVRMVKHSGEDVTDRMLSWSEKAAERLGDEDLCGFIFKKSSPSCGLFRVKVYDKNDVPAKDGRGLFAAAMAERWPRLPMEEEGRLADAKLRENFIERIFAYRRLKDAFRGRWAAAGIVAFHTAHKYQLLAHSPEAYKSLGSLTAAIKGSDRKDFESRYASTFMDAMAKQATPGRHQNVLEHMAGYFKKQLAASEKEELGQTFADFKRGLIPLIVPITLVRHYVRKFDVAYLAGQTYLQPHPKELMLRNHV